MNEALIERYIAFPESLDAQTRALVKAYIQIDGVAREVADFYRSYYSELRSCTPPVADARPPESNGSRTSDRQGNLSQ